MVWVGAGALARVRGERQVDWRRRLKQRIGVRKRVGVSDELGYLSDWRDHQSQSVLSRSGRAMNPLGRLAPYNRPSKGYET